MSDPADKSDDLIAELAKLMATSPAGGNAAVAAPPRPAPLDSAAARPAPTPIRIPGMEVPGTARPAPAPQPETRAPATGSIRIPGMDQPAPVTTSAPVSKFDFGKPMAAPVIRQEPLSSLTDRLAARAPESLSSPQRVDPNLGPALQPVRIPSDLKPVSENRSFAEGPALTVARPVAPSPAPVAPAPQPGANDFHFDFGFGQNPPVSATPPRPTPDPIADLIAAEMADTPEPDAPVAAARAAPAPVGPVFRPATPQAPARPVISPVNSGAPRTLANVPIPLKPVSVTPRSAESDRFAISPGVGLNMKPPATQPLNPQPLARLPEPQPHDESDPMSEIESLIGEAVRVELSAPGPVRVQTPQQVAAHVEFEPEADVEREIAQHVEPSPAPFVPPLTTQFAPRRTSLREDAGTAGAEDAILAAAAATGADVGGIEPAIGDDSPYRRLKVKPQRAPMLSGGMRQYVGMAVAGTLLLAAGLGLYWVLNMGRTANIGAAAPQLTADATPVKVKPEVSAEAEADTTRSPVLEQMDGVSQAPSAEQLVSTEADTTAITRDVTPAAETSESGLANRKVRTVTVRPDGTIVSGDDAVAGAEELPVDRPNVPDVPSTESTNLLGAETEATVDVLAPVTADPAATAEADIQPVMDPTIVAPTPMSFPVRSAAPEALGFDAAPENPVTAVISGAQTPNGQIDLLGDSADPQAAAANPVAPADSGNAVAYVQLASSPTEADANAAIKAATARYGDLFGGNKLIVQRADLGQKGIKYRVRLPAASLSDANSICAQIKAQGGDCFAING